MNERSDRGLFAGYHSYASQEVPGWLCYSKSSPEPTIAFFHNFHPKLRACEINSERVAEFGWFQDEKSLFFSHGCSFRRSAVGDIKSPFWN